MIELLLNNNDKGLVDNIVRSFNYLVERWEDERLYEDFKEYRKYIKKSLPHGWKVKKFTSSPFTLRVESDRFKVEMVADEEKTLIEITEI